MDKKMWVLTFSVILNVILAGAFGYTMGRWQGVEYMGNDVYSYINETHDYNYTMNYGNETNNYNNQNYSNQTNNFNLTFNLPNQTEGGYGEPTYDIVMLRGDCYNFPMWDTDGDCALGDNQIYIDNPGKYVSIHVNTDNSDNRTVADSFAIEFQFYRTDAGWYHDGVLAPTSVVAEITTDVETLVVYNTTTTEPIYVIKRTADEVRAIAWTNFYGDSFVGFRGGNLGSLTPGGLGSGTFTLYFNESDLPDYENGQGTIIENWTLSFRFSSEGQYVDMVDVNIQITFNP